MKNSANAKYKFSSLEIHMNKAMIQILCLQVFLALIAATIGANWIVNNTSNSWNSSSCHTASTTLVPSECQNAIYLDYDTSSGSRRTYFEYWIQKFGTWILIFTNFVPISLMVTFEVVKFW
jgi:phospholipid-transporting ATPase